MLINITNEFSYQTFPLNEKTAIDIPKDILIEIGKTKCFDVEHQCVIPYDNSEEVKITNINKQINELKQKLAQTDYQAIKYAEGRMSGAEYAPIGEQRQAWRDEINNLEKQL